MAVADHYDLKAKFGGAFCRRFSMKKKWFKNSIAWSLLALCFGCVSKIPVDEYTIARAAIDGARESEAPRYAPALWYKAEQAYREGETLFRERVYPEALKRFNQARTWAEQAENTARLSRFESGDLAP
jgi:hypothetical protein